DEPGRPEHFGAGQLGEVGGVAPAIGPIRRADMVAVAVRDEDQVDLAELGEVLVVGGRLGISLQVGVDHDRLAARRGDLERRVSEPEHLDLSGLGQDRRTGQYAGRGDDGRPPQLDAVATIHALWLPLLLPGAPPRGVKDFRHYNRTANHRIVGVLYYHD